MKKIVIYFISVLFLSSCKEEIPSEQELAGKTKGIWEVTEISTYSNGIENKKAVNDLYWNFNDYGDLVIHNEKKILFVTPIKANFKNRTNDSGKTISRSLDILNLQIPPVKGTYDINGMMCLSASIITESTTSHSKISSIFDYMDLYEDYYGKKYSRRKLLESGYSEQRIKDELRAGKLFIIKNSDYPDLGKNEESNLPIIELTDNDRNNQLRGKLQTNLQVKELKEKELILECDCFFLKYPPNYSGEEITKVIIKLSKAKDQTITGRLFSNKASPETNVQSLNDSAIDSANSNSNPIDFETLYSDGKAFGSIRGNLYRVPFLKFRLRFPEKWKPVEGNAQHTIAKFVQQDSGKSISIVVVPFKKNDESNFADRNPPAIQREKFGSYMHKMNIEFSNLNIENGYVNNFPATILQWNQIARSGTREID